MARHTSSTTEPGLRRRLPRSPLSRLTLAVGVAAIVQAALFYDHFAVALTLLFGFAFGVWLRSWKAAFPAVASFAVALPIAWLTGWLHDGRLLWEPLLGVMLAALGGAIGGGIFDVLRHDADARAPEPASTLTGAEEGIP